jgi:hypothetical protein
MSRKCFSKLLTLAAVVATLAICPTLSMAQITFERIVSGLSSPVFVTYAPGDADRLFIVLQGGQIRIFDLTTNTLKPVPFITVPEVLSGGERGLLGLAFHPDYQNNGLFYVNFTDNSGGDTRITQFSRIDADTADPTSGVKLMEIDQPQSNHNGGWIEFGPNDGFLYIATGDGGGAGDTGTGHTTGTGNAQDTTNNLLGKMLRIDVNGDDFPSDPERNYAIPPSNPFVGTASDDEIFLYGLRNPWRCCFDRQTGDLWIGDVGQGTIEEVTYRSALTPGGQNYGWRNREGTLGSQPPGGSIDPIYQYFHGSGSGQGFCIIGGVLYRGPIAALNGHYFFSDNSIGQIRSLRFDGTPNQGDYNGNNFQGYVNWNGQTNYSAGFMNIPSSFGEDFAGNMYICDLSGGEIFKLVGIQTQAVETLTVVTGNLLSGGVPELQDSDNEKVNVRAITEPVCAIEVEGTSPTSSPSLFSFTLEASTRSSQTDVQQIIEFFNYQTGAYEVIDNRLAQSLGDQVTTVEGTGNLSRFVEPNSQRVKAKLTIRRDVITRGIQAFFDQAVWTIAD